MIDIAGQQWQITSLIQPINYVSSLKSYGDCGKFGEDSHRIILWNSAAG